MRQVLTKALIVCLFILQAGSGQQPGEISYSDSPIMPEGLKGERIQSVIDTINSGSPERVRSFITTECTERFRNIVSMEDHISTVLGFNQNTGGVDFYGIRSYVPERKGETVVILKGRSLEDFWGLTIRFAEAPDFLIAGIGISPARLPAGMKNTDCYEMDYPVENLAVGYSPDWKSPYGWQNNLYKHVIKGGPAGGGFSTVKDLHKFALALLSGKLVSKESLKTMWTDHLKANYGYGFTVVEDAAGKGVGHSGGFAGINSRLDIYLDSGYIVAAMSNIDMGAGPVAGKINQLLARVKAE